MTHTLIYLIGFAGVGKYTVAKAISERAEVRIVDNHYILNPIFSLIEQDGITPLPPEVWGLAGQVHRAVLETVATLSPKEWNFVFTNELINDEGSRDLFEAVQKVAEQRGAQFLPVRLVCETDELCRRVVEPERRERMKSASAEEAKTKSDLHTPLLSSHPSELTLDTTDLSPEEAASAIFEHLQNL